MPLRISFHLGDGDLRHLEEVAQQTQASVRGRGAEQELQREQWLQQRREALQERMHARRTRSLEQAGSSVRRLFSLFGL
ncbi:MAG TPA: hypothetical protein VNQ81_10455 [Povalibacter sp.]|nr:hypothetical protein [Povalibacter sp.]